MKQVALILMMVMLLSQACNNKNELSRAEALRIIVHEREYPKLLDYDVYCGDPKYAKKALEVGLEEEGLVTIVRSQKLADVGRPLLGFTSKAEAYLLETPARDKTINIQRVKLADEDITEVTNIRTSESGKIAMVDYTTVFKNVSPFAKLTNVDFRKIEANRAYFALGDAGWKLEKKPGIEFLEMEK